MASFSNDATNPIFDAGNLKPMRTRTFVAQEEGKAVTRTERRPRGKYLMVIDSAGNELPLKLHNSIAETAQHDPYKLHQAFVKAQANREWGTEPMVPSAICPQQTEYQYKLPDHLQTGQKCVRAADGAEVGEDRSGNVHWCKCIKSLVAERVMRNAAREAARDPRTTIMEAVLNNSQEMNQKLVDLLKNMTDSGEIPAEVKAASAPNSKAGK